MLQRSGEMENKRVRYNVQIVSDGDTGIDRHFSASLRVVVAFLAAVLLMIIAALSYLSLIHI